MMKDIPNQLFSVLGNTGLKSKLTTGVVNIIPFVTADDFNRGILTRYFAKRTVQRRGTIYEIDSGQFTSIQNNNIFRKTSIDWIIRGKLEDTLLTLPSGDNILIKGVISQNKALLGIAEEELPGITNHLQNYMEFYSGE